MLEVHLFESVTTVCYVIHYVNRIPVFLQQSVIQIEHPIPDAPDLGAGCVGTTLESDLVDHLQKIECRLVAAMDF